MTTAKEQYELVRAGFNAGADARIRGWPRAYCPFDKDGQSSEWSAWRRGWADADENWARDAKRGWSVRKLPAVKEVA